MTESNSNADLDGEEAVTNPPAEEENSAATPKDSGKSRAAARALARAEEDARISATGRDEWHYIQNDEQFGPVPLAELKAKVADLSVNPPVKFAWHEGMELWKPVYEIPKVCGVSPLAATQCFKLPAPARKPGDSD